MSASDVAHWITQCSFNTGLCLPQWAKFSLDLTKVSGNSFSVYFLISNYLVGVFTGLLLPLSRNSLNLRRFN